MIYSLFLILHSLLRWFVLISLIYSIYHACKGWFTNSTYTPRFDKIRNLTVIFVHVQLLVGLLLYFISPVTKQLLNNFGEAVQQTSIRFYGIEHSFIMIIAVVLITIGSAKAKRGTEDLKKFKSIALWFTIGLILILVTIPWPFSPFDARPLFRIF